MRTLGRRHDCVGVKPQRREMVCIRIRQRRGNGGSAEVNGVEVERIIRHANVLQATSLIRIGPDDVVHEEYWRRQGQCGETEKVQDVMRGYRFDDGEVVVHYVHKPRAHVTERCQQIAPKAPTLTALDECNP